MRKQSYIAMLMAVLVLLGGAIWGVVITTGRATEAKDQSQTAFVPGPETNEKIEKLKGELEKTAEYEKVHGCVKKDELGNEVFCGTSKDKVKKLNDELMGEFRKQQMRNPEEVEKVKKNIRDLKEDQLLEIAFEGSFTNPFAEKTARKVESYRDTKGFEYWVDKSNNKVVQYGPGPNSFIKFSEKKTLTDAQLKDKAEKYLVKHISDFDQVKKSYVFETGSKGDLNGTSTYAFRWNAPTTINGEELMPFVQIVLSPSGEIKSFTDTRSLYISN
jgi:hypothetical protein